MPYCPSCNGRFQEGTFCPKDGTALMPDGETSRSLVGQVIGGRYRLTKLLGAGGMGEVYAAEHVRITKKVAVKLLHPEISSNQEAFVRFQQEAQSASNIGHDNIVAIDDFGIMDDGRAYLCMEFLEGQSLSEAMQARGGLDPIRACNLMIQVCDGLAAAHDKNIVHRDMKPENVFLTRRSDGSEIAKILDFGIAKVSGTDRNESLTRTGTVFGTPHYMSPEQALGQKLDHRADIYSVGVVLFEIFTGQVPFKAESFMGILSQHITKPTPEPSTVTPGRVVPRPIEDIILKAMQKEADKRFPSMREMRDALKACLDDAVRTASGPHGGTISYGGMAPGPASQPTAGDDLASRAKMAMQPTMASVSPQQGQVAPAAAPPPSSPSRTSEVIPKTVLGGQQAMGASPVMVAPLPTPLPMPVKPGKPLTPGKPAKPAGGKKSHAGLIIGLVVGVVVLGAAATAAVVFWDKITGKDGGEVTAGSGSGSSTVTGGTGTGSGSAVTAGTGSGSATVATAGTGSGSAVVTAGTGTGSGSAVVEAPKPDAAPAAGGEEPGGEEPGTTKKVGKKQGKKLVAKNEPKVEPKVEPKIEPKVEPKKKVEPKVEPPEECCTVTIASSPSDAAVLRGGRPIGRTPYKLKLGLGESASLTLAKGGHADQAITVRARNGTQSFKLRRKLPGAGGPDGIPGADPGIKEGGGPF